jgi:glycosyltransferase involved in cell wall biosynthesis
MRIGIDARFYGSVGKGLGRYVSELIAQLEKLDTENEYFIFLRRANWDEYAPKNPKFTKVLAEFHWYGWSEQIWYPIWLRKFNLDLMHFAHFNVPLSYRRPFVVTVHDLILLSHPTPRATTLGPLLYRLKYSLYRLVISNALRRSRTIITVSQYSKKEIEKNFPFTKQRGVVVTYEACGTAFHKLQGSGQKTPLPPEISGHPFVLYVGNAYPHKNLERLIQAFAMFRRQGHSDHHLILVGGKDYFYDRLQMEARRQNLAENVVFYGQADDAELAALYDAASFYVFPSLCEGFGLPPLEAMCRGLAVASSDATCLPEVLGDAAYYFDPDDAAKIAAALEKMASSQELRQELIAKGRQRTTQFDWQTCARTTRDIYLKAVSNAG